MSIRRQRPARTLPFWPVLVLVKDGQQRALAIRALEQNNHRWPDRDMPRVEIIDVMLDARPCVAYKDWRDVPAWIRQLLGVRLEEVLGA